MKGYEDQRYPMAIDLEITLDSGDVFEDGIKGLNPGHALWRAWWNWPAARAIRVLPDGDLIQRPADRPSARG